MNNKRLLVLTLIKEKSFINKYKKINKNADIVILSNKMTLLLFFPPQMTRIHPKYRILILRW